MNVQALLIYAFELCAVAAALSMLFIRNVFYGALLLIVCLLSLAGIYVLAFAEFVGVTQILIYAGGILVLILFAIMLSSKISGKPLMVKNNYVFGGILTGTLLIVGLILIFSGYSFGVPAPGNLHQDQISRVGVLLMTDYLLPFEAAGILLLIALLGAAMISSGELKKE